jgi:hypothetical protein
MNVGDIRVAGGLRSSANAVVGGVCTIQVRADGKRMPPREGRPNTSHAKPFSR